MSQDPTQFDPKETTEAKLCAYVDGDLDAAGRAEIEKYLETNPQHRKLLEELKQTRDLMRALPRASAPPDIGETLHGQLERSLLLNDLDAEPAPDTMRISSGAQFRAIAAVLVLALGLGALVYYMLPSSKERVAVVAPPPLAAEHDHEATAPTTTIVPEMEDHTPAVAVTGGPASAPAAPAAPGGTSLADASKEIGNRRALSKTLAGKGE
ncbi:MAG TPA: hypothetical protein VL282_18590, partial [Tepidisphaeraceae bacterium]|nr:hypothetical protein [Tepidisphaeraceae bacterium]